jgi:carboxylesterase type B
MRSAAASLSAAALLLLSTTATATTTTTTTTTTSSSPTAHDSSNNITYRGLSRNNLDLFLGIPYAHDTSGTNRFKPPVPLSSLSGSIVDATAYGPACPQSIAEASFPFALTPVDVVSEDCLHLNIARPKKKANKKNKREDGEEEEEEEEEELLPVMVYIHGGSFWYGQSSELVISPDGLVLESVENGTPVIHVAMNYRLGGKKKHPSISLTTLLQVGRKEGH